MTRIAKLREAKGLTQAELARAIDADTSTIRNMERNRSGIQAIERIAKLCKTLDCRVEDLLEYVDAEEVYDD